MTIEYQPSVEDVFRLKQALHRRATRNPLIWTVFLGGCLIFGGGVMMAPSARPRGGCSRCPALPSPPPPTPPPV